MIENEEEVGSMAAARWKRFCAAAAAVALVALVCAGCTWKQKFNRELPRFGHRNWIVVADSAYPCQCSPGIETLAVGGDQIERVRAVLDAVDKAPHVRAVVYLDAELDAVPEDDAPGIDLFRAELDALLEGRPVKKVPHEEIIARLDETAKFFNVLLIKTDLTLPYTSVFLELDCGYWSAEAEQRLRDSIGK
jgi:hypothetical protein